MAVPSPSRETTALVTGASSGIGSEFARALAARGHGVTLVARREDRLRNLAQELHTSFGVRAEAIPADLTDRDGCQEVVSEIGRRGLTIDVLVNSAGFGIYSAFADSDLQREFEQMAVLMGAVIALNGLILPGMVKRGRGTIINVSSTAGLQPLPGNGTYAACKAFVLFHSEAMHAELRGSGVTVTAVCPGPVKTEFQDTSDPLFTERLPGVLWCTPERVAADGLRAAERGRRMVIPGSPIVRGFFGPNRSLPVRLTLPVARRLMGGELRRGQRVKDQPVR